MVHEFGDLSLGLNIIEIIYLLVADVKNNFQLLRGWDHERRSFFASNETTARLVDCDLDHLHSITKVFPLSDTKRGLRPHHQLSLTPIGQALQKDQDSPYLDALH